MRTSVPAESRDLGARRNSVPPRELNRPLGPRKRFAFAGMADADVKSILETLEKELGAVLR